MSCISGYKLTNNLCISNFNYGFSITFNVASNSAFVSNYYNFLLQLANSINTTISNIAISNINYVVPKNPRLLTFSNVQSVAATASGMISTPATSLSTQADTQYSALSTLMSSGTIGGMQVSVYSLSTNGGSVNDNEGNNGGDGGDGGNSGSSSSSTVIIIATVVPICLVRTI
jgi:hypothetical protein